MMEVMLEVMMMNSNHYFDYNIDNGDHDDTDIDYANDGDRGDDVDLGLQMILKRWFLMMMVTLLQMIVTIL